MKVEKFGNGYEIQGTSEEIKEILPYIDCNVLKEVDNVSDELQLTSNRLDYIRELVLQQDKEVMQTKIKQLKQSDGEGWAIGETIERILDIKDY